MVIEACKRDGVKSTTRGTVAGLGIEVSSVCGVLAMLGNECRMTTMIMSHR